MTLTTNPPTKYINLASKVELTCIFCPTKEAKGHIEFLRQYYVFGTLHQDGTTCEVSFKPHSDYVPKCATGTDTKKEPCRTYSLLIKKFKTQDYVPWRCRHQETQTTSAWLKMDEGMQLSVTHICY